MSAAPPNYTSLVSSLTKRFHGGVDLRGEEGLDFLSPSCRMISNQPDRYTAYINARDLSSIRVNKLWTSEVTGIRGPRFLDDEHSPFLAMGLVRDGRLLVEQNRTTVKVLPGETLLIDYASTFTVEMLDQLDCVFTYLPHDLLSARQIGSRKLGGSVLPSTPLAAALATVLESLFDPVERSAISRRHIESAVLDLSLAILHEQTADVLAPEEIESGNLSRAIDFIDTHFSNPSLSVAHVAASINASPRYVHKLFEGDSESVYGRIRRLRIEYSISLLTDATCISMPISEIAIRSGFTNSSQFSRAIRQATGFSPREIRHGSTSAASSGGGIGQRGITDAASRYCSPPGSPASTQGEDGSRSV